MDEFSRIYSVRGSHVSNELAHSSDYFRLLIRPLSGSQLS